MYKISQSSLKDLERSEGCPFLWNERHITKSIESKDFPAAKGGKYFEYKCLGTDTGCIEMPPLKNGGASVETKRIDDQADLFKLYHDGESELFNGLTIIDRDVYLETDREKGIIDYVVEDSKGNKIYMDLKLVQDLYQGYYKYGDHDHADYTQQVFYQYMINKLGIKNAKIGLFVFEKGAKKRILELSPISVAESSIEAIQLRIEKAYEAIDHYTINGWTKYPSYEECKDCQIQCEKAFIVEDTAEVEKEEDIIPLFKSLELEI